MTEMSSNFLKLLFNPGETICVSSNKFGYHSVEQSALDGEIPLISPNEKIAPSTILEKDVILVAINPITGWRRDEDVTAFRTFLIEVDTGSLEEQKKYIEASGMPYSACIFSGNKSLHYAIVLDEDFPDISSWRWFNQWLLKILTQADQQVKNPSRSIRFPGNKRKDGKALVQALVEMKGRVKQEDFLKWIYSHSDKKPAKEKKIVMGDFYQGALDVTKIPQDVLDIIHGGINENRNGTWFYVACRIAKLGFEMNNVINYLQQYYQEETDFKRREWETCIKSAYKRVQGGIHVEEN